MGEIWTSHLEEYLLFVQGTKNFSHHTLVNYRRDIQKFMEFLRRINGDGFLRCGVDTYTARRYLATLVAGEYARRTIARQIAVLRSYGRYLCREQLLESNPFVGIRTPKLEQRLPQFLDVPEIAGLMELPEDTVLGRRDAAIMELLYSSGLRVSELTGLTTASLDCEQRFVLVFGKRLP